MPRRYREVCITGEPGLLEHLIGLLSQLGFEGFWEETGSLRAYMNEERWAPGLQEAIEQVVMMVMHPGSSPRPVVTIQTVEDRNWNAEWEQTIRPIRVSNRIVIRPSWHEYPASPGEIVLIIDPKMSFGTGYHETTRLTLRLMEQHLRPPVTVLDVGTGTGVLAIAAIKLGASRAVGTDVDEWSFTNARENAAMNGVDDRVAIYGGTLDGVPPGRFGMVVANIQRGVLEELMPELTGRLDPEGILLLSGLLEGDEEPMNRSLRAAGFTTVGRLQENEWIALAARRIAPAPTA